MKKKNPFQTPSIPQIVEKEQKKTTIIVYL